MSTKFILIKEEVLDSFVFPHLNQNDILDMCIIGSQKENCYKELQRLGVTGKNLKQFKSLPVLIRCDSWEEVQFYAWCVEAKREGLIGDFVWKPDEFVLIPPQDNIFKDTGSMRGTFYGADVVVKASLFKSTNSFVSILNFSLVGNDAIAYIDIKPSFQIQNSRDEVFQIKKKLMFREYGIYVNEVLIKSKKNWKKQEDRSIFERTWCPDFCRWTPTGKHSSVFDGCRTVEEFKKEMGL